MNKVLTSKRVQQALRSESDPKSAVILRRFFKTCKGEYGEGDVFWGIKVPVQRRMARTFRDLPILEVETLLQSPV
ncbi:MAG: DNA alkylation repair protein, partial [Candidatus Kerfeldbacteria bacterium]|nr:DNA alkylation repair protein [Candidatus Kerfeldbacteria bacterium]